MRKKNAFLAINGQIEQTNERYKNEQRCTMYIELWQYMYV